MNFSAKIDTLNQEGFAIIDRLYSTSEIEAISSCFQNSESIKNEVSNSNDLFSIRQLLTTLPELSKYIFNKQLIQLIHTNFSSKWFLTKAIYFDKPKTSNWFVPFHQDISISVDKKSKTEGYKNWTSKKGLIGVQPPRQILEDTLTVRIHLDDTTINNGALNVIPKSHLKGVIRKDTNDWSTENEHVCELKQGGVMLMKPLTLHASNRTTNNKQRRVIHLEFNNHQLSQPLNWLEYKVI